MNEKVQLEHSDESDNSLIEEKEVINVIILAI